MEIEQIPTKRDYFIQWKMIKEVEDSKGFKNTMKRMDTQVQNLLS